MTYDVTIVTHRGRPDGAVDDLALADALCRQGATSRFAVWSAPRVDWSASLLTIVRSTWDYHLDPDGWFAWLDHTSAATSLVNPAALLRWNSDKSYLDALARRGLPVVPTIYFRRRDTGLAETIAERGWSDVVVKPAIGASAFGARRFDRAGVAQAVAHVEELARSGTVLVQPFQDAVLTERERSLVMIDGHVTHAFLKNAFDPGAAGGTVAVVSYIPDDDERDLAVRTLAVLEEPPIYARVDIVPTRSGPRLMELELIEPFLALDAHAEAADCLALALTRPIISTRPDR